MILSETDQPVLEHRVQVGVYLGNTCPEALVPAAAGNIKGYGADSVKKEFLQETPSGKARVGYGKIKTVCNGNVLVHLQTLFLCTRG